MTHVVLEREGERVTVLWTMRPEMLVATLDATTNAALRVDKYGELSEIRAEAGRYRVPLDPATANSNRTAPIQPKWTLIVPQNLRVPRKPRRRLPLADDKMSQDM